MAMTVNHEFDLLEARFEQLYDVVDAFILQESNITTGTFSRFRLSFFFALSPMQFFRGGREASESVRRSEERFPEKLPQQNYVRPPSFFSSWLRRGRLARGLVSKFC